VAGILAIRDGLKDAREGRPAYFWTTFVDPARRWELLREGWNAMAVVFFLAAERVRRNVDGLSHRE